MFLKNNYLFYLKHIFLELMFKSRQFCRYRGVCLRVHCYESAHKWLVGAGNFHRCWHFGQHFFRSSLAQKKISIVICHCLIVFWRFTTLGFYPIWSGLALNYWLLAVGLGDGYSYFVLLLAFDFHYILSAFPSFFMFIPF